MRSFTRQLSLACLACVLAFASSARADARAEAGARSALKRAAADYRAKRYAAAGTRLEKALRGCADDQCAPATRAALLRDLGIMQLRQGDAGSASQSFADALALEPDLALDPRYDRPPVSAAWNDAKQRAADAAREASAGHEAADAGPPPPVAPEPNPGPPPPVADEPAAETQADAPRYEHLWIGVAGAFDVMVFPGGSDLCKLTSQAVPANSFHAYCTNPDGSDFPVRATATQNGALVAGQGGSVATGLQIGDVRAMLAVDYALSPAWLVGVRVGYVLNTYTGTAAVDDGRAYRRPLHAEVRGTYLFGREPLTRIGFAPMVFLGGGMSEFDGHVASSVVLSGIAGSQRVNVWITDGPWFVTLGGGVRYQFSLRSAFTMALRVNASLADNGVLPTAGPEVEFQYGF
jgi:hypothetical protein